MKLSEDKPALYYNTSPNLILEDNQYCRPIANNLVTSTKTENKVESRLLLDVVIRKGTAILELLTSKDKTLLIRRNSFLILDLGLDVVNRVGRLHVQGNGLSGKGFHENLLQKKRRVRVLLDVSMQMILFARRASEEFLATTQPQAEASVSLG